MSGAGPRLAPLHRRFDHVAVGPAQPHIVQAEAGLERSRPAPRSLAASPALIQTRTRSPTK